MGFEGAREGRTHRIGVVRVLRLEVVALVLERAVQPDVLHDGVTGVSNDYHDGLGGRGNGAEVVSETEDRPVLVDCTEAAVLAVSELRVLEESGTDGDVRAGLESRALGL